jgi:indole-3-glycerol phosphate synthase
MDALFECHTLEQITSVPPDAQLYGINSRSFNRSQADYAAAQATRGQGPNWDATTDLGQFQLGRYLPHHAVRVAESGLSPATIAGVRALGWFDAVLVGSWLLLAPEGVFEALRAFEQALAE